MARIPADLLGRELNATDWTPYFDDLNRRVEQVADIETTIQIISDTAAGDEAAHLPLSSITWEDEDDVIAIGVGGRGHRYPAVLWHFVEHPRQLWVHDYDNGTAEVTIRSEGETLTVIRLHP
jgi:hypothetical protein